MPALRSLCAAILAGLGGAAPAADWSLAMGLASDKVVRGISQTAGQPSLMVDLGWRGDGGLSASLAAASLHSRDAAEFIAGLAWQRQLNSQWQAQLGLARYEYTAMRGALQPYTEVYGSLGWDGRASLLLGLSPDVRNGATDNGPRHLLARHLEFTWHQRLVGQLSLDLGLGISRLQALPSYRYGSIGLGWSQGPVQLFTTVINSNAAQRQMATPAAAGRRWVVAGNWQF